MAISIEELKQRDDDEAVCFKAVGALQALAANLREPVLFRATVANIAALARRHGLRGTAGLRLFVEHARLQATNLDYGGIQKELERFARQQASSQQKKR